MKNVKAGLTVPWLKLAGIGLVMGMVVFSLTATTTDARRPKAKVPGEFVKMKNPIPGSEEALEEAGKLYKDKCEKCHGEKGDGKGTAVKEDMKPVPPAWTDKAQIAELTDGERFWIILNGSEGTEMKGFKAGLVKKGKEITEEQAWKMVHLIKTFAK